MLTTEQEQLLSRGSSTDDMLGDVAYRLAHPEAGARSRRGFTAVIMDDLELETAAAAIALVRRLLAGAGPGAAAGLIRAVPCRSCGEPSREGACRACVALCAAELEAALEASP